MAATEAASISGIPVEILKQVLSHHVQAHRLPQRQPWGGVCLGLRLVCKKWNATVKQMLVDGMRAVVQIMYPLFSPKSARGSVDHERGPAAVCKERLELSPP